MQAKFQAPADVHRTSRLQQLRTKKNSGELALVDPELRQLGFATNAYNIVSANARSSVAVCADLIGPEDRCLGGRCQVEKKM